MQSRLRYFVPLILAALLPMCSLAETSVPTKAAPARWALFKGKNKGKKQPKHHKAPKAKHSKRATKSKH